MVCRRRLPRRARGGSQAAPRVFQCLLVFSAPDNMYHTGCDQVCQPPPRNPYHRPKEPIHRLREDREIPYMLEIRRGDTVVETHRGTVSNTQTRSPRYPYAYRARIGRSLTHSLPTPSTRPAGIVCATTRRPFRGSTTGRWFSRGFRSLSRESPAAESGKG